MQVTDIRIRKTFNEAVLRAIVSVTFDDCFTVHDIKIIYVNDHYIIVMPNKKNKEGRINDICHPINSEFRQMLEKSVLEHYNSSLS